SPSSLPRRSSLFGRPRVSASVTPARVFDARQHVSARWGHTSRLSFASGLLFKVRAERALANRPAPLPRSWLKARRSFTVQHARAHGCHTSNTRLTSPVFPVHQRL
ncbi:hypothetical protein BD626DRAFT_634114, partial [Schizophyllum amplum]